MKRLFNYLYLIYKNFFSYLLVFLFGKGCRFTPTCSDYLHEAIERYGMRKGLRLFIPRFLKCHPGTGPGFDPVP